MTEHQKLVGEHKNLLSWVSIIEDDMGMLKANSFHGRKNISMPSSVEVRSGSKHVRVKCGKVDADNDGLKSEARKAKENDDGIKLDDEDLAEEEKKKEVRIDAHRKKLYQCCTHQMTNDIYVYNFFNVF